MIATTPRTKVDSAGGAFNPAVRILTYVPNDADALWNAAVCAVKMCDRDTAIHYIERFRALCPEDPRSHEAVKHAMSLTSEDRWQYTDRYGETQIEHSTVGRATVFVSGSERTSFHAPGTVNVTL